MKLKHYWTRQNFKFTYSHWDTMTCSKTSPKVKQLPGLFQFTVQLQKGMISLFSSCFFLFALHNCLLAECEYIPWVRLATNESPSNDLSSQEKKSPNPSLNPTDVPTRQCFDPDKVKYPVCIMIYKTCVWLR